MENQNELKSPDNTTEQPVILDHEKNKKNKKLIIIILMSAIIVMAGIFLVWLFASINGDVYKTKELCEQKSGVECSYTSCENNCPEGAVEGWVPVQSSIDPLASIGDDITVRGKVTNINYEPLFVDGDGIIEVKTDGINSKTIIKIPARQRICPAREAQDVFDILKIGDQVEIYGRLVAESTIVPCDLENHFFRIIKDDTMGNCVREGEYVDHFDKNSFECCPGLNKVDARPLDENCEVIIPENSPGIEPGWACISCGDGACSNKYENKCNCPEDCTNGSCKPVDESKNCNRSCDLATDCQYTCGCGAINKNETCEDNNAIYDCVFLKVECRDKICVTDGDEDIGFPN